MKLPKWRKLSLSTRAILLTIAIGEMVIVLTTYDYVWWFLIGIKTVFLLVGILGFVLTIKLVRVLSQIHSENRAVIHNVVRGIARGIAGGARIVARFVLGGIRACREDQQ